MKTKTKEQLKVLFEEAGLKILPDMKAPIESRRGKAILATSFKLERSKANLEGVKELLKDSNWKAFAFYAVLQWTGTE